MPTGYGPSSKGYRKTHRNAEVGCLGASAHRPHNNYTKHIYYFSSLKSKQNIEQDAPTWYGQYFQTTLHNGIGAPAQCTSKLTTRIRLLSLSALPTSAVSLGCGIQKFQVKIQDAQETKKSRNARDWSTFVLESGYSQNIYTKRSSPAKVAAIGIGISGKQCPHPIGR